MALALLGRGERLAQIGLDQTLDLVDVLGLVGGLEVPRLLRRLLGELDDRLNDRLEAAMAEHDGLEHLLLGELLGLGLHHHDGIARAGNDEIEVAARHLVDHRVEDVLAVDEADAGGADRAEERHARQRQRRRGRHHADDVGIVLHVVGQHGDDDLGLVLEALHEQRADRPVDEARGQRLLLARAAFAFEEAAGNLAGGVGLLLIVDGQRKEIDAGPGLLLEDHGGEHAGLAVLRQHRGIGLPCDASRLEAQLAAAPLDFHALCFEHLFRLVSRCSLRCSLHRCKRRAPHLSKEAGPHLRLVRGNASLLPRRTTVR